MVCATGVAEAFLGCAWMVKGVRAHSKGHGYQPCKPVRLDLGLLSWKRLSLADLAKLRDLRLLFQVSGKATDQLITACYKVLNTNYSLVDGQLPPSAVKCLNCYQTVQEDLDFSEDE